MNEDTKRKQLDSWKQIAAFLECSERTAQRYLTRGLPVHYLGGHRVRRVFAYTDELSTWARLDQSASGKGPSSESDVPDPAPPTSAGPAAKTAPLCLEITGGQQAGIRLALDRPIITLGREFDNRLVVTDPDVSRYHARLIVQNGQIVVEDLKSKNGTFLNGRRLTLPARLARDDRLRLGRDLEIILRDMPAAETV